MQILQSMQKAIFPPACPLCKEVRSPHYPDQEPTPGCCAACLNSIHIMSTNTCMHCGTPLPASFAPGPCGHCLTKLPPQQQTKSLYVYKGAVREALLAWKLQGDQAGLSLLMLAAAANLQHIFSPDDLLVPVPMPISRMRRSGIHHSADLCQSIASITGCKIDWKILRRVGNDSRQSSLKGKARKNNLRKAFTLADGYANMLEAHNVKGKIWVIDDILTTGATLRHACQTMRRTKRPVFAFSFARTLLD